MNVSNITGVGRVVLQTPTARPPENAESSSGAKATEKSDSSSSDLHAEPAAPRFPWLSRLTRELEPVSKQPSPYGTVPILGEQIDRKV